MILNKKDWVQRFGETDCSRSRIQTSRRRVTTPTFFSFRVKDHSETAARVRLENSMRPVHLKRSCLRTVAPSISLRLALDGWSIESRLRRPKSKRFSILFIPPRNLIFFYFDSLKGKFLCITSGPIPVW